MAIRGRIKTASNALPGRKAVPIFDGFEDRDFSAAGFTAQGGYLQFRMKFDQDTAAEIISWLN